MAFLLQGTTVSEVWRSSLELFLDNSKLQTYPGPGGELCYELENVILVVNDPTMEPRFPDLYYFPDIHKLMQSITNKKSSDIKTIYDRIYAWGKTNINQITEAKRLLKANIYSRQCVVSISNPLVDTKSGKPPCPSMLQLLVRNDRLNITSIIRSTDAWLGAVADMLTFIELQEKVARDLRIGVGTYVHHSISYHLYDYNYLQVSRLLDAQKGSN